MNIQKSTLGTLIAILLLTTVSCVADISADKYNKDGDCWGPSENVGNDWWPNGCDTAAVVAVDSNGDYWRFPDSCIADGYDPVEDDRVLNELFSAPKCND